MDIDLYKVILGFVFGIILVGGVMFWYYFVKGIILGLKHKRNIK